jgi:hypothetical protein
MAALLECTYKDIESLSPLQLVRLLRTLLYVEARAAGIAATAVQVSLKIDVADAGEDGRIQWQDGPEQTEWLASRFCLFQSKATALTPSQCKTELLERGTKRLKARVEEVLDAGGAYYLFYGRTCNPTQQTPRIAKMREALKEAAKAYAETCKLVIYDANRIAEWANKYLSATLQVFTEAKKPLPPSLENWASWAGFADFTRFEYVPGDGARDGAIVQLRTHYSDTRKVARIVGLSGLGKTRVALEVFRPPADGADIAQQALSRDVAYVDANDAGSDLLGLVQSWRREGARGILVVDNCDRELHDKLAVHVTHVESHLSLLTIGSEPEAGDSLGSEVPHVQLGPVDDKVIEAMLKQQYTGLRDADLNFIARELAMGFPQMAVLIAGARLQNRDIEHAVPDVLLRKLVGLPPDSESAAYEILSYCALFAQLGVFEAAADEFKWVAKFAGVDADRFYESIQRFKKRGIVSQHGNFVQVRPRPLAMRLSADWWSRCSPEKAQRLIEGDIAERLAEALCERVRVLDYVPAVRKFVEDLCGEQRPFGQAKVLNSKLGSRLFRSLVEVNPEATANALKRVFADWNIDALRNVVAARRNLVWALQNLCFWKSTFQIAARVLLKFAAAENESWSNNATGVFLGLFKVVLSRTQATPNERLALIDDALTNDDERCRLLGVQALGSALQTHNFIAMAGPEQQGSRFPQEEWRPKYYKEAFAYWDQALSRLGHIALQDERLATAALNELAHHIRELASVGRVAALNDVLVPLIRNVDGYWPEGLSQVQHIKEYDFDRMPEDGRNVVLKWEELLQPKSFDKRVTLLVTEAPYEHHEDASGEFIDVAAEKAKALAIEASTRIDDVLPLLARLLAGTQRQAYVFGYHLVEQVADPATLLHAALRALEQAPAAEANSSLLTGMLAAAQTRTPVLFEEVFSHVERSDTLRPYISDVTRGTKLSPEHLKRIGHLVTNGSLDPRRLHGMSYGRALDHLPGTVVPRFADQLTSQGTAGAWIALDILFMYAHGSPERWHECRTSFRHITLVPRMLAGERVDQRFDTHAFGKVIEKLLKAGDAELATHIAGEIGRLAGEESWRYDLEYTLRPIIDILLTKYAEQTWPIVAAALLVDWRSEFNLSNLLGGRFGAENTPSLVAKLGWPFLLAWCEQNPKKHAPLLASMIDVADRREGQPLRFTPIAQALIDTYGTDENLLSKLSGNIGSYTWTGSLVPYFEQLIELFASLLDHKIARVREWARNEISYATKQAQRERDRDAEREIGLY